MADQILDAVIQLEARLEQQLQSEQQRADAWLEGVRREQQQIVAQGRRELTEKQRETLAVAQQAAEQQAATILHAEMEYCHRLEEIDEQTLLEVLRRQLNKILPGQVDDHQNGESRNSRP